MEQKNKTTHLLESIAFDLSCSQNASCAIREGSFACDEQGYCTGCRKHPANLLKLFITKTLERPL